MRRERWPPPPLSAGRRGPPQRRPPTHPLPPPPPAAPLRTEPKLVAMKHCEQPCSAGQSVLEAQPGGSSWLSGFLQIREVGGRAAPGRAGGVNERGLHEQVGVMGRQAAQLGATGPQVQADTGRGGSA